MREVSRTTRRNRRGRGEILRALCDSSASSAILPVSIQFIQFHPQVFQNAPVGTEKGDGYSNEQKDEK